MMAGVELSFWLMQMFISPASKVGSLIIVVVGVLVGVVIYGGITLKTRLADQF